MFSHPFAGHGRAGAIALVLFGVAALVVHGQEARPKAAAPFNADLYGDFLPKGAAARLGTVRYTHAGGFTSGTYLLPDGSTAVTAKGEHAIRFWNARSGKLLREFRTEPMNIGQFAVSEDGTRLAVAGYWFDDEAGNMLAEIRILDASTGQSVQTLKRDSRDVDRPTLAFSPDSKLLVSLGGQGVLRIEEVATGLELLTQTFPRDNSPSLAVSPDGKTIAVQTGANTEKFFAWDWQSGKEPRELTTVGMPNGGGQITFSPDGRQIAWASHGRDAAHVWEAESGTLVARLMPPSADEYFLGGLAFAADGKQLLTPVKNRTKGRIAVWNTQTWVREKEIDLETARFALSRDGKLLVSGNLAWDLEAGRELSGSADSHRDTISQIAVPQAGTAITASDDQSIRVWDDTTGRHKLRLQHDHWVRAIAVSPDASRLVSSSLDDTVRLWDLATGNEIYRLPGHGSLGGRRAVAFSKDGRRLCSFGDDFYLRIFDVRNGKALEEFKIRPTGIAVPEEDSERDAFDLFHVDNVALSSDGAVLVVCASRKIFLFDVASGKETKILDHEGGSITSLAFSPDSQRLLVCAWGKGVETKLPDGRTRFSAAKNHTAALWNVESGKAATTVLLPDGAIGPGAFSPDGSRFAVASGLRPSKVTVFKLSGEVDAVLPEVPGRIWRLAFRHDGLSLITALDDSTALVWGPEALRDPPLP